MSKKILVIVATENQLNALKIIAELGSEVYAIAQDEEIISDEENRYFQQNVVKLTRKLIQNLEIAWMVGLKHSEEHISILQELANLESKPD